MSIEVERRSSVVHSPEFVTILWRNIWRWELVNQQVTIRSIARNLILGSWTLWRDGYFLLPRMSGMLLLHEPTSSGICFVHISIYMKMRWLPITHSTTVLLTALNKMKTEGSGNIPVPITFLFIERLNKYLWKYAFYMYFFWLQTRLYLIHINCGGSTTKFRADSDRIPTSCSLSAPQHLHGICAKQSVTQYWKKCFKPALWHSRRMYVTSLRFCMSLFCILFFCLFVRIMKKDVP
jgi:hypothetical protein